MDKLRELIIYLLLFIGIHSILDIPMNSTLLILGGIIVYVLGKQG